MGFLLNFAILKETNIFILNICLSKLIKNLKFDKEFYSYDIFFIIL